MSSHKFQNSVR